MATIVARKGSYQVKVRRKGVSVSQTFIVKATAEAWGRKTEHQIDAGTYEIASISDFTLQQALLDYADEMEGSGRKGWYQEKGRALVLSRSDVALKPLAAITSADVIKIRQERLAIVSGDTVRRDLVTLSSLFHRAQEVWQLAVKNPVKDVKRPPPGKPRDRRLKPGELEYILAATRSQLLPAAVHLAIATAMRRGELAGLSWRSPVIDSVLRLHNTKNGEIRDVPFTEEAKAALSDKDSALAATLTRAFSRAVKRARATYEAECVDEEVEPEVGYLQDLRFHDLRHEATSRLFEDGLSIMEASAVTGHKSLQMLKRYTHLDASTIADKLNAAAKSRP